MQTCELHNSTGPLIKTVSRETMLKLPDGKYPIIDGAIVADRATYYLERHCDQGRNVNMRLSTDNNG